MEKRKNIPELRFPGFEGEWERKRLQTISSNIMYGLSLPAKEFDGINKYLRITDIDENSNKFLPKPLTSPDGNLSLKYKLKKSDLVFTRTGASVGKTYLYDENDGCIYFAGFLIRFNISRGSDKFVFYNTLTVSYWKWVKRNSMRLGQPGLNATELGSLLIPFPTLPEQEKIAGFLSAVDKRIELLRRKKELTELYKKGVMQKLFSREIRFRDDKGNPFPDWEEKKLGEVLFEHGAKSSGKESVYSVSVHKGLINQIEHLGRSFAASNTDHYNLVRPHDIVYTKSPTGDFPYGIIKMSKVDKDVIVSPLYGVFSPENKYLGYILDSYFESPISVHNYLHSIIQKGAKNTINITNNTFLSNKMYLPVAKSEQKKIAEFLQAIDKKIELLAKETEKTELFKKGLLQKMFV